MLSNEQIAVLQGLQLMVFAARDQSGIRVYHETHAWGRGGEWSVIRAVDDDGAPLFRSAVAIGPEGDEMAIDGDATTLAQQRDKLAAFIAANRINRKVA